MCLVWLTFGLRDRLQWKMRVSYSSWDIWTKTAFCTTHTFPESWGCSRNAKMLSTCSSLDPLRARSRASRNTRRLDFVILGGGGDSNGVCVCVYLPEVRWVHLLVQSRLLPLELFTVSCEPKPTEATKVLLHFQFLHGISTLLVSVKTRTTHTIRTAPGRSKHSLCKGFRSSEVRFEIKCSTARNKDRISGELVNNLRQDLTSCNVPKFGPWPSLILQ